MPTAAAVLISATPAFAHAQLLGTSPASGATVRTQPREVIFEFNQDVGGTAGAVRVYDAHGNEVDDLDVSHPNGDEHWMGVGLKPHLPDGTYTATYRVISADTHIVYGGLVFDLGHAGAAPKFTVAGLIGRNETGHVTKIAFGVVRALNYLTLALFVGGLVFLLLVWRSALATAAGSQEEWSSASHAFASRIARLFAVAILIGVIASVLGVLLQGASAAGVSLWSSLKGSIVESTLQTRFGWVWGARAVVWLLLGVALLATRAVRRCATLSVPAVGEGSDVAGSGERAAGRLGALPRATVAILALGAAYLTITPALAGHASVESPVGVFFPSDVIHVLAGSIWVGGIACLLLALPAATGRLQRSDRSRLLLATLARFSPIALGAVVAIAATGVLQAYIDVRSLHGLLHTTYGALIIAKTVLLLVLIAFGWVNRQRVIPLLQRVVAAGAAPGGVGALARRTMRGELALMIFVFGVTAALISYAPPIDAASGPFSTNTTIGAAELEMSVEPAKVGPNAIHLYLIDAKTGAQFTATKELTASAKLPAKGIGPLALHARLAGPGHYILESAVLSPGGTWQIEIVDRVSEFEQHTRVVEVPIG
ncbi:MAG TPA: CopD family protein [Solirubrobacteraceae bacterium]|nr:CopD family protein [Solirubrobacteraceae bacterium]